jgi:hypothetical protein
MMADRAACRSASSCLSHEVTWFQLARMRDATASLHPVERLACLQALARRRLVPPAFAHQSAVSSSQSTTSMTRRLRRAGGKQKKFDAPRVW